MVDLTKSPFYLSDVQIEWVNSTIHEMTIEEKIGQLFIYLTLERSPEHIKKICTKYHMGGLRWQGGTLLEVYEQNRMFQEYSKIPMLIAANCEAGGNGAVSEGTLVATPAACGASKSTDTARDMGYVSGIEAQAVGCNWTFAPVSDLLLNWRNTIVNTRAFGKDAALVTKRCLAYMEGIRENNIACCTKHFPGDGVDERDHHLQRSCNDLTCEEWDASFGKVYKALIDADIESVMVGHISLPSYSKKLRPDLKEEDIMPATLSPELIQDLLRDQLGFQGLILTDASHMAGLTGAAPRSVQVPGAIAAGCDMFLFVNDIDEDYQYMMDGYQNGMITEERLDDALHRILGIKAKLGFHQFHFPNPDGLKKVGCKEHLQYAEKAADYSITLLKDTQKLLPINPTEKKRVKLYFVESAPVSYSDGTDVTKQIVIEELTRAGFEVTPHLSYYEMEAEKEDHRNRFYARECGSAEELKKNFDLIFMFFHMKGYAQENNVRIRWSSSHSNEIPWFTHEVPTLGVSLSYTNHLIDLPMLKTYINTYSPTREYIRACIQKIIGRSEFQGEYNDNVWCGRWDTKL